MILALLLCGYESFSFTVSEERSLRRLKNKLLMKLFASRQMKYRERRNPHIVKFHKFSCSIAGVINLHRNCYFTQQLQLVSRRIKWSCSMQETLLFWLEILHRKVMETWA
jgi:hypothetical protein